MKPVLFAVMCVLTGLLLMVGGQAALILGVFPFIGGLFYLLNKITGVLEIKEEEDIE